LDNLTHTLVGVTLVRAGLGRRAAGATAAMVIASNIPDADIVTALGGQVAYLAAHRGPTHGPLGVIGLGLVAALLAVAWRARRQEHRAEVWKDFGTLATVGITGTLLHVLMDLPTQYGTRLLSPFDETWFSFDWMPIIDIYLWAVLALGLVAARMRREKRQAIARGVLIAVLAIYGVRGALHGRALDRGAATSADGTASPCASAPVLTRHPVVIEAAYAGPGRCLQAAALPAFLSPFEWRIIRQQADGYEMRDISLLAEAPLSPRVFVPSESDPAVALARTTKTFRVFLGFSRFPATRAATLPDGTRRVRAVDVRFVGQPPRGLEPDPQARAPFVATVEVSPSGRIVAERLGN
jgi:inner membrane protein